MDTYFPSTSGCQKPSRENHGQTTSAKDLVERLTKTDGLLKESILLKPGVEQQHSLPPFKESEKQKRKARKLEREKTKGSKWFDLPATEVTDEIKNDLSILQMRSVLNPKQFYKKNDLKVLPKYFQVGKVLDNPVDFYHSRVPKKERKQTLVDELLADAEFRRYNKKKYAEITSTQRRARGAHRHMQRLKRKKK